MSETELIARVREGDEKAYRQLLDQHLGPISHYVGRMMSGNSDADDIVQETLIRLWTHADRYDPRAAKVSTWLHNIAHNLVIDHFRKHGRLVPEETASEPVSSNDAATAPIERTQGNQRIAECLMALPERQRSAIVMCHYQGMSNKDAAAILDVSVEALESLMARGRRKLRQLLSDS